MKIITEHYITSGKLSDLTTTISYQCQCKLGVQEQEVRAASASGLFYPKVPGSVKSFLIKHSSCGYANIWAPQTHILETIFLFETSHILTPVYLKSLALAQGDGGRQNQSALHSVNVFI